MHSLPGKASAGPPPGLCWRGGVWDCEYGLSWCVRRRVEWAQAPPPTVAAGRGSTCAPCPAAPRRAPAHPPPPSPAPRPAGVSGRSRRVTSVGLRGERGSMELNGERGKWRARLGADWTGAHLVRPNEPGQPRLRQIRTVVTRRLIVEGNLCPPLRLPPNRMDAGGYDGAREVEYGPGLRLFEWERLIIRTRRERAWGRKKVLKGRRRVQVGTQRSSVADLIIRNDRGCLRLERTSPLQGADFAQ